MGSPRSKRATAPQRPPPSRPRSPRTTDRRCSPSPARRNSRDFEPCLFETSNDVRALANYEKACQAEAPEAKAALQALLDDLARRRDGGDAVAGEVLRVAAPKALAACGG